MTTTFQKRQKEMKRLDKQREKAARRAQRKQDKREGKSPTDDGLADIVAGEQPRPEGWDPQGEEA
jgi:hypothetical protein